MTAERCATGRPTPGRLALRRWLLLGGFLLAALLVVGRAFQLQALEHERWTLLALNQQREREPLPARRGAIYDRDGVPLALSHETYRVSIAPRELRDPVRMGERLVEELGIARSLARRATSPRERWVVLPGRFSAQQREALGDTRGVYFERRLERFYPQGAVGREVIGVVSADGRALGGVEQQFDALLRGEPGYSVLRRDASGGAQPTISLPVVPPTDGADVHLTIDFDLQEIADGALREAIRATSAAGGDMLIVDPRTGEILAAISRRGGQARGLTAITEPYEPGSTLKPFTAAALLAVGRAELNDTVYAEEGVWRTGSRTIRDSHAAGWISMAEVLRHSSNIGIVKLASRLSPGQQYAYLRDFGFGTPTGIEYPAESTGRLRRPAQWSRLSSGSLAMGYEISVTPLQLTAAYAALANDGVLMEPHLLREVRDPGGAVVRQARPQAIRRVVGEDVAREVTEALVAVVEDGTATRAGFADFRIAGKTGTARRTGADGRYVAGSYTSTFVGYFPAEDPQIVIYVKLDRPEGVYYGGAIAAPVTRETLQGIMAARGAGKLDGRTLLAAGGAYRGPPAPAAPGERRRAEPATARAGTYVFVLEEGVPVPEAAGAATPLSLPSLEGLSLRDAARRAHGLGLRVAVRGTGAVVGSEPAAGAPVLPGDTVVLVGSG